MIGSVNTLTTQVLPRCLLCLIKGHVLLSYRSLVLQFEKLCTIDQQQKALDEKQGTIDQQKKALNEKQGTIDEQQKQIEELQKQLRELKNLPG